MDVQKNNCKYSKMIMYIYMHESTATPMDQQSATTTQAVRFRASTLDAARPPSRCYSSQIGQMGLLPNRTNSLGALTNAPPPPSCRRRPQDNSEQTQRHRRVPPLFCRTLHDHLQHSTINIIGTLLRYTTRIQVGANSTDGQSTPD